MLLRSFSIQGSWNYRTLQGAGVGFALSPILSQLFRGDGAGLARSVARHVDFFNAHPYLATIAIGALARLEAEKTDEERIRHFKKVLVGPLGTLGDRLIWARWRPLCLFLGLLAFMLGASWWLASLIFLATYNALHLWLRVWGLRVGWRQGQDVGRTLLGSPLRSLPDRLTIPLAAVGGALLAPLALAVGESSGAGPFSIMGIAVALSVVGFWRPVQVGRFTIAGVLAVSLIFAVLGMAVW